MTRVMDAEEKSLTKEIFKLAKEIPREDQQHILWMLEGVKYAREQRANS